MYLKDPKPNSMQALETQPLASHGGDGKKAWCDSTACLEPDSPAEETGPPSRRATSAGRDALWAERTGDRGRAGTRELCKSRERRESSPVTQRRGQVAAGLRPRLLRPSNSG